MFKVGDRIRVKKDVPHVKFRNKTGVVTEVTLTGIVRWNSDEPLNGSFHHVMGRLENFELVEKKYRLKLPEYYSLEEAERAADLIDPVVRVRNVVQSR